MRRLLAVALALIAVPATAQDAPAPGPVSAATDAQVHRLYDQAVALARSGDRAGARALLEQALALLPGPSPQRGFIQCVRGIDYLREDIAIARGAIEECRRLGSGSPRAETAYVQLMLAERRIEPAMETMVRLLRAHPETIADCDTSGTGAIATWLRMLNYERLDTLRGELVSALIATPCGLNDAAFFSGLALKTIRDRVARGDRAGAVGLLPAVVDPDDMLALLIDPRVDPIRAEIEKQAGPTLVPQREALLQSARSAAARVPDYRTRKALGLVLARTGHRAEAIEMLRALLDDPNANDPDYFDRGTTVTRLAEYLSQSGETDAERVVAPMRRLLAKASPRDRQGLWNVIPNLALWLLNYGKDKEALAVLEQNWPGPGVFEEAGAYAYFTTLRGCAEFRLGDPKGREKLESVRAEYPGNLGARRLAALCGPDGKAQREELLAIAADPNDDQSTLASLVRLRTLGAIGKGPPTLEHAAMLRALADPEFAARLDALTRPLAPSYRGALANWN